jgi:hypothetical protein
MPGRGHEQPATTAHHSAFPPLSLRERPWLLPYNRKLRHLQGITIRNLTLTPNPSRQRTKTVDDEGIPSTLKSPTKSLALRESRRLSHSRSSSDLQSTEGTARHGNGEVQQPPSSPKLTRPTVSKGMRRRSTIEWQGASLLARQKRLEDITDSRMADTFFSLHVDSQKEPIYISEVVERAMNPNFRFFDLASCGPGVTRLDRLTIKVWAKNENTKSWQYLVDFTLEFRLLQFIGKALGNFRHPLPPNCILFHMTDGIYTSFIDLPVAEKLRYDDFAPPKEHPEGRALPSSSYDALMRLNTLDDCIQDALATRDRLAEEIESVLSGNIDAIGTVEQVPEAEERLKTVEAALAAEKRRVEAVRRKRDELEANIKRRRELMQKGREIEVEKESQLPAEKTDHTQRKDLVERLQDDITGQRRRICEDLQVIYPIEPVAGKPLLFMVRGLLLPNTEFEDAKEDVTAAALGYVAHMVSLLSPYLSVVLPYPMKLNGSTSTIDDDLAMGIPNHKSPRTYPLFMKGVVRYRFEYGVFLLNKNIEVLSNSLGLRPINVRHTLPNLKYLLFVATAGKGELPARKAGGIKGLLRGTSRNGSIDSTGTASSAELPLPVPRKSADSHANVPRRVDQNHVNNTPTLLKAGFQRQKGAVSRLREVE